MVVDPLYRRPPYVRSTTSSTESEGDTLARHGSIDSDLSFSVTGIPPALSLDRIISGGTCPPCTTRDFMYYLQYIEHSAENLQFYLWLRHYMKRFAELPEPEKALAPAIPSEKLESDPGTPTPKIKTSPAARRALDDVLKNTDFEKATTVSEQAVPPFSEGSTPELERSGVISPWDDDATTLEQGDKQHWQQAASAAYEAAEVKIQPFSVQPYREEITRIIATYLSKGAPRELNLAARERADLLRNLAITTHPSAFTNVLREVEWTLRHQAHPNFIRWTIRNGNQARVTLARGLGVGGIVAGLTLLVILTVSGLPRAWRALSAIPLIFGISTLWAAWRGMCVVLHGMHHRQLRPWELFVDAEPGTCGAMPPPDVPSTGIFSQSALDVASSGLGGATFPSYEDAPWVARYDRRNLLRKTFDREVWIQEPALRHIQDSIFVQAMLVALAVTAVIVGVFCAIPPGNRF